MLFITAFLAVRQKASMKDSFICKLQTSCRQLKQAHQKIAYRINLFIIIFSIWVFFHEHSQITGLQGKGEGFFSSSLHFHPLHKYLDIGRAITAESSPLQIASSRTRTGNLWFPSANRKPLRNNCNMENSLQLWRTHCNMVLCQRNTYMQPTQSCHKSIKHTRDINFILLNIR